MLPLTNKELKSHEDTKICYICRKYLIKKLFRDINYQKVRDHCYYTGKYRGLAHSICNLKFNVPNIIPAVFHNSSKYDYHFIIKELAEEPEGPFECIGENSEIYKSFFVPIKKKVIIIDKKSNKPVETISCKTEFIHSMNFMATSLSKLVDNLPEIYGKKCRDKNCKSECEFKGFKNNKRSYNCKKCRIEQLKPMNKLSKTFSNTYKFVMETLTSLFC